MQSKVTPNLLLLEGFCQSWCHIGPNASLSKLANEGAFCLALDRLAPALTSEEHQLVMTAPLLNVALRGRHRLKKADLFKLFEYRLQSPLKLRRIVLTTKPDVLT